MTDIVPALRALRPGARWTLDGDTLAGLDWQDEGQVRPGDEEILAEAERLAALPPMRAAPALRLRYALNEAGQRAAWNTAVSSQSQATRDYWDTEPNPPETSPKLRRIAKAAGVDLGALFDAALAT